MANTDAYKIYNEVFARSIKAGLSERRAHIKANLAFNSWVELGIRL